jgi:nucleotide-binding universal stress UspA family protein
MEPSHVLVPLDGSPLADDALEYAVDVFECRITVLNVVTPLDNPMSEGGVLELDPEKERNEEAHKRANRIVEDAREKAGGSNIETAVKEGDPAEAIIEYFEQGDIDQIVMGGHSEEPTGVVSRLLGTVATTVVSEAPVSVTVVR